MLTFARDQYQINVIDSTGESFTNCISKCSAVYLNPPHHEPVSTQTIEVHEDDKLLTRILLGADGGGTGVWDNTVLLDNDRLVTCCSNTIYCLSVPDLKLLWKTQADQATCFCIYQYQQDYIVHGELEISRLDSNGKIVWRKSGADIFVTLQGDDNIELREDCIIATDFEYNKYTFDYDGRIISYVKAV